MTRLKIALINIAACVLLVGIVFIVPKDFPTKAYLMVWGYIFLGLNLKLLALRAKQLNKTVYNPSGWLYIALTLFSFLAIFPYLTSLTNR